LVSYLEHTSKITGEHQFVASRTRLEGDADTFAPKTERTTKHKQILDQYTNLQSRLHQEQFHLHFDTSSFYTTRSDVVGAAAEAWSECEDRSIIDPILQEALDYLWHFYYVQDFAMFAMRTDVEAGNRPAEMWASFTRKVNVILKETGARVGLEKAERFARFKRRDY
jgi:hypothetical protein